MSTPPPNYTDFHPRWHRPGVSTWWFLKRTAYIAFILRELSCVFVAWSVVFLLLLIRAVGAGAADYADFLDWAETPWVVALNIVTLAFLVYHAVTWFQLTPKAMVIKLNGRRLPGSAVAAPAFGGWVVVSLFVTWLLLRD